MLGRIWLPKDRVTVLEDDAESFANFLEALEDHDDVQRVFHNAEESEE